MASTKHTHIVKRISPEIGFALPAEIAETLAHADLSDMPDVGGTNTDHDARYYTETEVDSAIENTYTPTTLSIVDIDFSNESSKDVTVSIGKEVREVLRGRIWIDTDEGAFSQWATLTFYSKNGSKRGEDAIFRTSAKLVYTEVKTATVIGSPNIIPDIYTDFSPDDLIIFQDDYELARLKTIAATMIAEDNILAIHAVDVGISRVIEFSGFSLYNMESGTDVYCKIEFSGVQTVSLKMELVVRT